MRVAVDFSGLKKIKWSEYAVRFVFDGTITAAPMCECPEN